MTDLKPTTKLASQIFTASEALAVHDGGAALIILTLGDPHLLEGAQGGQDGASDPHAVLTLRGCHDLDLHGGGRKRGQLLRHSLANALEHGCATGQHHVRVEVLTDVHIALHDGLEGGVVDAAGLLAHEAGLEKDLRAAEALGTHGDDVAVWQLIRLLLVAALARRLHLAVEIQRDVAKLLLDVADNLTLRRGGEGVAALGQDLHHVLREVTAGQVQSEDGMGQGVALVDRHGVRHAITTVLPGVRSETKGQKQNTPAVKPQVNHELSRSDVSPRDGLATNKEPCGPHCGNEPKWGYVRHVAILTLWFGSRDSP